MGRYERSFGMTAYQALVQSQSQQKEIQLTNERASFARALTTCCFSPNMLENDVKN